MPRKHMFTLHSSFIRCKHLTKVFLFSLSTSILFLYLFIITKDLLAGNIFLPLPTAVVIIEI